MIDQTSQQPTQSNEINTLNSKDDTLNALLALTQSLLDQARYSLFQSNNQPYPDTQTQSPERLITIAIACLDAHFQALSKSPSTQISTCQDLIQNRLRILTIYIEFIHHAPNKTSRSDGLEAHVQDVVVKTSLLSTRLPILHPLRPLIPLIHAKWLLSITPPRTSQASDTLQSALTESMSLGMTSAAYAQAILMMTYTVPWQRAPEFWRLTLVSGIAQGLAQNTPCSSIFVLHSTLILAVRAMSLPVSDWDMVRSLVTYSDSVIDAVNLANATLPIPLLRLAFLIHAICSLVSFDFQAAFKTLNSLWSLDSVGPISGPSWSLESSVPNQAESTSAIVLSVPDAPSQLRPPNDPLTMRQVILLGPSTVDITVLSYLLAALVHSHTTSPKQALEIAQNAFAMLIQSPLASRIPRLQGILLVMMIDLAIGAAEYHLVTKFIDLIPQLRTPPPLDSLYLVLAMLFQCDGRFDLALSYYQDVIDNSSKPSSTSVVAKLATAQILLASDPIKEPDVIEAGRVLVSQAEVQLQHTQLTVVSDNKLQTNSPLISLLAMLKVPGTIEIVPRKQALLDALRCAVNSVVLRGMAIAMAGCVYAETHAVSDADKSWMTVTDMALKPILHPSETQSSQLPVLALTSLARACTEARKSIENMSGTSSIRPGEHEIVCAVDDDCVRKRQTAVNHVLRQVSPASAVS